ncbi:hypothetical protein Leryth_016656 [Lithospermum erythrorhizon]|nr:hypothetical protein Leryth_016656 [Lithospermum erythrorhizon]
MRELVIPWFHSLETYRTVLEILREQLQIGEPLCGSCWIRDEESLAASMFPLTIWKLFVLLKIFMDGMHCQKHPKASLMGVYYAKKASTNDQNDLQLIASSVVLAALAAPPYDLSIGASHLELENEKDRNIRMANLIGFNLDLKLENREVLSRSSLLAELVSKGVMSCVTQEVKDLYHLLEHEFLPLDLASKVEPLLTKISKVGGKLSSAAALPEVKLSQYVPSLEKLATLRLLQQVSQVYQTVKIENLSEKIPFIDFSLVEKISVDAMKHKFISMKVDHMKGTIIFNQVSWFLL